jgi:putative aldouronate transport system permease protein
MSANIIRRTKSEQVMYVIIVLILIMLSIIFLYPLVYVISMSLSDSLLVARREIYLLPRNISLDAYEMILEKPTIWVSYYNTVWYTVVGTCLSVTLTMLIAYPLSRDKFVLRKFTVILTTIPMWFTGGMIPTFILIKNLGMYNTRWAIILLGCILPWNIIITRTFLRDSIHDSLVDAAFIDGCNDLQIFAIIVLPLSKAIIAVNVLFYAVNMWNHYFKSMLYLSSADLQPLQIYLRNILFAAQMIADSGGADSSSGLYLLSEKLKYAVIVFGMLPILFIYPFLQKYFVKGVMIGSIKG